MSTFSLSKKVNDEPVDHQTESIECDEKIDVDLEDDREREPGDGY